ncbi:autotransporter assembly complex protein TamA [Colwellia psychrerythraea]|uniref:Translocation and assembly module subunit TamA n=1 Tax=Colwellia psychrerythraea TaxID=28229 RepID=A0A099KVS4_COLPS|nr:autotransporter assembly complex family protein [Colwellia psychrerythraea]KGJ93962.1 surface antigen (D15) [Colwellia psychrerythraea]
MLSFRIFANGLILFVLSHSVKASNLVVSLKGQLPEIVHNNVRAHLGSLPKSDLARSAFIYTAKDNTQQALQALGYYQAEIIATVSSGEKTAEEPWQLILNISLNSPTLIDKVSITLDGQANQDTVFRALLNNIQIKHGQHLHHGKYEDLKSDLLSLALQRGYFNGELTESKITIKQQYKYADISLHYQSGPRFQFGDVNFSDFDLEPELLSSLIPFQKEEYYSTSTFHELQHQLQSTQYFGSIIAVPGAKIEDNVNDKYTIPIHVSLTPAKSHQFDFGVGYATDTEYRLSAAWRTPLINKYGHFQETKFEYSKINPTGKFIYSVPLSHPRNDLLQFQMSVEYEDYADQKTQFFSTQIGRLISDNLWQRQIYTRYHKEKWKYELDVNEPNIEWSEDAASYLIPGITWSRTIRLGSPLDPSEGFRQTYNIEGAHLKVGSDNSFFRIHGRWNYITTLKANHRLVTRAEYGAIYVDRDAELAPSLRFYAGGDQSIRGFAYQSIGSTIPSSSDPEQGDPIVVGSTRLIVASIEYQYYLNNKWRVALFSDGGSAADKGEFELVYSFGTGLHYISPVGAIKLDVAYGINDYDNKDNGWRLHINLGAEL